VESDLVEHSLYPCQQPGMLHLASAAAPCWRMKRTRPPNPYMQLVSGY